LSLIQEDKSFQLAPVTNDSEAVSIAAGAASKLFGVPMLLSVFYGATMARARSQIVIGYPA
jgi:sulfopyruvate decarboxylase TPP-binding subunit